MAVIYANVAVNMWHMAAWSGSVLSATSNQMVVSDGSRTGTYTGDSFVYSGGLVVSGTLRGYSETLNGVKQYDSGMSVPVATVASLINSNNVPELLKIALTGDDVIAGSAFSDSLSGYGGNDIFYPSGLFHMGAEDDFIDGGAGMDTVSYDGYRSDYVIEKLTNSDWRTVSLKPSALPLDLLENIERISFVDGTWALDAHGTSGQVYRLYKAAFDRAPDPPGLGWNIHLIDKGTTQAQMADAFVHSAEFTSKYGSLSNEQFITQLYANVLHRTPDPDGMAWNLNLLNTKLSRADMLSAYSESAENQAAVIGQIQDGIWFT